MVRRILSLVLLMSPLSLQVGCRHAPQLIGVEEILIKGLRNEHRIFAISGRRLSSHSEEPLTVATYSLHDALGRMSVDWTFVVYTKSIGLEGLPETAIIIVKNEKGSLKVLGSHAQRSIFR